MRTFAASVALVLILGACAVPTPAPSDDPGPAPSDQPVPSSTASPLPVDDVILTVSFDDWTASCYSVESDTCRGVAGLFVNNLARSWQGVLTASGGGIDVTNRGACPAVPYWADPSHCWQATAKSGTGPVCMVIARQKREDTGYGSFGQVGGAEMAGRAGGPPAGWPLCE